MKPYKHLFFCNHCMGLVRGKILFYHYIDGENNLIMVKFKCDECEHLKVEFMDSDEFSDLYLEEED